MTNTLGAAIGSAIAIIVLLYYAPIYKQGLFGISYSPRLMACWLLPIVDIIVTLYLIAGNWFGLGEATGYMMTQLSIWTAIGLSGTVFIVRKLFVKKWRQQYKQEKVYH